MISTHNHSCNIIIPRPADHGLYVIQSRHNLIFTTSAMSSSSDRLIVATTSSPSYQLGHKSALALSKTDVLRVAYEPNDLGLTKTTCRPTPFWTRLSLTFGTSTSASTIHHTIR